jgi:chromosome segregation ATPase
MPLDTLNPETQQALSSLEDVSRRISEQQANLEHLQLRVKEATIHRDRVQSEAVAHETHLEFLRGEVLAKEQQVAEHQKLAEVARYDLDHLAEQKDLLAAVNRQAQADADAASQSAGQHVAEAKAAQVSLDSREAVVAERERTAEAKHREATERLEKINSFLSSL